MRLNDDFGPRIAKLFKQSNGEEINLDLGRIYFWISMDLSFNNSLF